MPQSNFYTHKQQKIGQEGNRATYHFDFYSAVIYFMLLDSILLHFVDSLNV